MRKAARPREFGDISKKCGDAPILRVGVRVCECRRTLTTYCAARARGPCVALKIND